MKLIYVVASLTSLIVVLLLGSMVIENEVDTSVTSECGAKESLIHSVKVPPPLIYSNFIDPFMGRSSLERIVYKGGNLHFQETCEKEEGCCYKTVFTRHKEELHLNGSLYLSEVCR